MVDTNNNNKSLLRLVSHQSVFSAVRSGDLQTLKNLFEQETSSSSPSSSSPTAAATTTSSGGGAADGGGGGGGGDHLHQSGSDSGGIPVAAPPHPLLLLRNDLGETALYVAADNNLQDVFNYLLKFSDLHSASIRSNLDMNPFHVACKRGHLGIVKELLSTWPVLCQICDSSNTSPLYAAAVQDHLDVVNAILDVDESCIRIVRKNGKTSLHTAARYGLIRIVKALLDRDPEIASIKDKKGQTALHMAVKGQDPSVVEELLYADSSILNARDKKGNTAVHIATRKCRPQIVALLVLSSIYVEVNAINNQKETAMDLADKLQYGESKLEIEEALVEAGAKHARFVGQVDEAMELKRTVSDIKHEVHSQLIQNAKTHKRMSGIAKELQKLHREAVQNTTNSVTVVAVLFASIAFMAIFNLPGQYLQLGPDTGKAYIADKVGFQVFCLMNATSLFISLAVVVVQITLVAWDTDAQKQVVSVVNKLMWAACLSTCGAFLSLAFVVVGNKASWMAVTLTVVGGPILLGTLGSMCYFVLRQHFGISGGDDSQRRIKRASGRKSFSWSRNSAASDPEAAYDSDHERIYAL